MRFAVEVARRAVAKIGKERVGMRISPCGVFNDMTIDPTMEDTFERLVAELDGMAATALDLILNAEALLDEYVSTYLMQVERQTYATLKRFGMTPGQKFHVAMGHTGIFDVTDDEHLRTNKSRIAVTPPSLH